MKTDATQATDSISKFMHAKVIHVKCTVLFIVCKIIYLVDI